MGDHDVERQIDDVGNAQGRGRPGRLHRQGRHRELTEVFDHVRAEGGLTLLRRLYARARGPQARERVRLVGGDGDDHSGDPVSEAALLGSPRRDRNHGEQG